MTSVHRGIVKRSRGRLLGRVGRMQVLILTTTGRKTGKARATVLTSPIIDDGRIVLVASYGGDANHPQWFLNLRHDPDVTVTIAGQDRALRARVASPQEKAELWRAVVAAYQGYESYQRQTTRDIPVVILEPRPTDAIP
ncbi:MAG: nitroreductase/quinone reductase family protein [Acidimicrobiales bacterium]